MARTPYSTLVDGRIVWITPGEKRTPRLRSRRETDEEVLKRLIEIAGKDNSVGYRKLSGKELDDLLGAWGIAPRQWIDEAY